MPDIVTGISFLRDLIPYKGEKPYYIFCAIITDGSTELPTTNIETETVGGIAITDVRGRECSFRLATHGFEVLQHESNVELPVDSADTINAYKREAVELLERRSTPTSSTAMKPGCAKTIRRRMS